MSKTKAKAGFCTGTVKATGKLCTKRAKHGRFCGVHDPSRKDNKKMNEANVKRILVNLRTRLEDRYNVQFEDLDVIDLPKRVDLKDTNRVLTDIVAKFLDEVMNGLIFRDSYSYMRNDSGSVQFPRRVWQKIAWNLSKNDGDNLAMTCRKMYKLCITDKMWHYTHPLGGGGGGDRRAGVGGRGVGGERITTLSSGGRILSPRILHMPIYRLVSMSVMENLENVLTKLGKPTIEQLMDEYIEENGPIKSELKLQQIVGWMVRYSTEHILMKVLEEEREDLEETISGAGFFSDLEYPGGFPKEAQMRGIGSGIDLGKWREGKGEGSSVGGMKIDRGRKALLDMLAGYVRFVDVDEKGVMIDVPKSLVFPKAGVIEGKCETWLLLHCPNRANHFKVHAKALNAFVGFDGENIVSLMKWT